MFEIVAVDTDKRVDIVLNQREAQEFCDSAEELGRRCSQLRYYEIDFN